MTCGPAIRCLSQICDVSVPQLRRDRVILIFRNSQGGTGDESYAECSCRAQPAHRPDAEPDRGAGNYADRNSIYYRYHCRYGCGRIHDSDDADVERQPVRR